MYLEIIQQAIRRISHDILKVGTASFTSFSATPFKIAGTQSTIFNLSLIARALTDIQSANDVCKQLATTILKERSEHWSWNYWPRLTKAGPQLPYPDDLDDTIQAFIAIQLIDHTLLPGEAWAHLLDTLINAESQPGGPYRTWINPPPEQAWQDIDPVVNANIGYLMKLQNVSLPNLEAYFHRLIKNRTLKSRYYVNDIPTLFFLSSWYSADSLKREVSKHIAVADSSNALMLSLLIGAGLRQNISLDVITPLVRRLVNLRNGSTWPAEALYIGSPVQGRRCYIGSNLLTASYAVQAIQNYQDKLVADQNITVLKQADQSTAKPTQHPIQKLPNPTRSVYKNYLKRVIEAEHSSIIMHPAEVFSHAFNTAITDTVRTSLNCASINGWMAYTIYDDFLDGAGDPQALGVANIAHRQMINHFKKALPNNRFFSDLVQATMTTIDCANTWEVTFARIIPGAKRIQISSLPNYKNLGQLADRSLGHMLVACGCALLSGIEPGDKSFNAVKDFFRHFLIARQLNDDAHDWQEDLANGHLSAVVVKLLQLSGQEHTPTTVDEKFLKKVFWHYCIDEISRLILVHCKEAERAIDVINPKHSTVFIDLLSPLRKAAQDSVASRDKLQAFSDAFKTKRCISSQASQQYPPKPVQ